MLIARSLQDLREARARVAGKLAFVPTMGALHAGHMALVATARATGAAVAASIFVNPLQFGQAADLARYPRDEPGDLALLRAEGCTLVWLPSADDMYPPGHATFVDVNGPALGWEGAARPGHFRGVATVVAKLFSHMHPDDAFFGEKDWQQLQVIRRMTTDLGLRPRVHGVPTARAADGLALSSRNVFLTEAERALAPMLYRSLSHLASKGRDLANRDLADARAALTGAGFAVEYLELVQGESLLPAPSALPGTRLIAAARLGSVRLLDNVPAG